jgi:hypothetical protein
MTKTLNKNNDQMHPLLPISSKEDVLMSAEISELAQSIRCPDSTYDGGIFFKLDAQRDTPLNNALCYALYNIQIRIGLNSLHVIVPSVHVYPQMH